MYIDTSSLYTRQANSIIVTLDQGYGLIRHFVGAYAIFADVK